MVFNATFNKLVLDMTIMRICQNESLVKVDFLTLIIMDIDGRDCMVVGFTTTYAISAYHH
jgi:hypothetical protein